MEIGGELGFRFCSMRGCPKLIKVLAVVRWGDVRAFFEGWVAAGLCLLAELRGWSCSMLAGPPRGIFFDGGGWLVGPARRIGYFAVVNGGVSVFWGDGLLPRSLFCRII